MVNTAAVLMPLERIPLLLAGIGVLFALPGYCVRRRVIRRWAVRRG